MLHLYIKYDIIYGRGENRILFQIEGESYRLTIQLSNIRNWRHVSGFLIAEVSVFVSTQDLWTTKKSSFLVDVF